MSNGVAQLHLVLADGADLGDGLQGDEWQSTLLIMSPRRANGGLRADSDYLPDQLIGLTKDKAVEHRLTKYDSLASNSNIPLSVMCSAVPSGQLSDSGASSLNLGGGGAKASFGIFILVIVSGST